MTRPAEVIRNKIISEVLTGYLPAYKWDESSFPFYHAGGNNENIHADDSILLTRQSGQGSDEDIRELIVECLLFTPVNASGSQVSQVFDDATAAMSHLLTDYKAAGIIGISVIEDVGSPLMTGQNRQFCRFTVRTLVNS